MRAQRVLRQQSAVLSAMKGALLQVSSEACGNKKPAAFQAAGSFLYSK
jgi:hypothetical protein